MQSLAVRTLLIANNNQRRAGGRMGEGWPYIHEVGQANMQTFPNLRLVKSYSGTESACIICIDSQVRHSAQLVEGANWEQIIMCVILCARDEQEVEKDTYILKTLPAVRRRYSATVIFSREPDRILFRKITLPNSQVHKYTRDLPRRRYVLD